MKIEFHNIQVFQALSRETPCFTADLFVDGVLEAHVSNHGGGGGNDYHFPPGRSWATLEAIEGGVRAMGLKKKIELDGVTIELDLDLELLSFLALA
ncbi:hypothetical protein [Hyphomonas oceanitis]|uniref:Uncharacterized protein n=1 Tax=Hyphomonas oceanitis SCH89 TaxID=1280953 RepID=A0A059G7M5_9PROT|nr:hypothetical protein [Hyphomonas oceanitis]KDA02590.1 hypothetical protein HOC_10229 [Hyphomonas oceanitis SCH89]